MVASRSTGSTRSSSKNPCPICGRTKDEDCEIRADGLIYCHRGASHHPPDWAQKPGDHGPGADGQQWAFLGISDLGNAMFKPHEGKPKGHLRVLPSPGRPDRRLLARLPDGVELPDLNRKKAVYRYGPKQQTRRDTSQPKGKVKPRNLVEGVWRSGAGTAPWPLYQQELAISVASGAGATWLLELEGERCVGIAMADGLVAISQPGHNFTPAACTARYAALKAARVHCIFYVADNDDEGRKKAATLADCAAAAGLEFVAVNAADVWPGICEKGSIDDVPGSSAARVAALEDALHRARLEIGREALATAPAAKPQTSRKPKQTADGFIKPVALEHHEILSFLPDRLGGQPRLNIRTRDVHLPDRILSGDEAARLYLELSNPQEKWPKEATFDAVQHLAARGQFDPVAEYLEGLEATTAPLPMEEWNRLDLLLFNIEDPIAAAFLPRFFITAVARTFQPGCIGRQWPVLIGEKGIGKSDLPKLLFNIPGLPEGFVDNPGDLQRDGLMKAHRSWCVELAELNGISRRADKEHLKAFLSERTDTYRAPYSRAPASHPRRFVFWGTSNGPPMNEADPRFVCIPLPARMLPFAAVDAARDAIWARALEQYRSKVCWHTVGDDFKAKLKERNEDHTVTDPWADQVTEFLKRREGMKDLPVTIPDLMDRLKIDNAQRNNAAAVRLIELAGSLGWVKGRHRLTPGADPRQGLWPKGWK